LSQNKANFIVFDITSAVENDGVVSVTFIDSRTVSFDAGNDSAAIVAELQDYADEEDDSDNEQLAAKAAISSSVFSG